MNEELQAAAEHLDAYGYCVLKDRIPREVALALGGRCLALHSDPRFARFPKKLRKAISIKTIRIAYISGIKVMASV